MNTKTCKQCGVLKPIAQFRQYYGGRKGTYNTCKVCEKINSRYKYLKAKAFVTNVEDAEITKIEDLYKYLTAAGLQPPRNHVDGTSPLNDVIDNMLDRYKAQADGARDNEEAAIPAPFELHVWLTAELTEEPEYYQDEVYETLKAKYRPQLYIDTATMLPVYDSTHKLILDKILERFNMYEDNYYNTKGGE